MNQVQPLRIPSLAPLSEVFTTPQRAILIGATMFFGVQLLPNWWPWLLFNAFAFFYPMIAGLLLLVLGMAECVALISWLAFKEPNTRLRCRQWFLTFGIALLMAVGCTVANAACLRGLPMGSYTESFDSQVWTDRSSEEHLSHDITPRQKMLGDALRSVVQNGTRQNIIAQLGPPIMGRLSSPDVDTTYCTGPQRDSRFRIDSEWLSIWFDESGKVTRWDVWSD